jgi:hypothetical protein
VGPVSLSGLANGPGAVSMVKSYLVGKDLSAIFGSQNRSKRVFDGID